MSETEWEDVIEKTTEDVIDEIVEEEQPKEEPAKKKKASSVTRRCQFCGEELPTVGQWTSHVRKMHPEEFEKLKTKMVKSSVESRELKAALQDPEEYIHKYGREGLNKIKRMRLEEILRDYSDIIKQWQRKIILRKWDYYPEIRDNPQLFIWTLVSAAKVAMEHAVSIAQDVFGVEREYADILQAKGLTPVFFTGWEAQAQHPQFVSMMNVPPSPSPTMPPVIPPPQPQQYGYPSQPYSYQPHPAYSQPYGPYQMETSPTPPPRTSRRRREEEAESNYVTKEELVQILENIIERQKQEEEKKKLNETIDLLKTQITVFEQKLSAMEKQEKANPEIESLKSALAGITTELQKLKEAEENKAMKALSAKLVSLESSLEEIKKARVIEGYTNDTYRLLSQALERRPLEVMARILFPERYGGPPPVIPAQSYLPADVTEQLRKEGLVA
ncbi:MAG: hypothetical protein NZ957_05835 [Thaumarchaeota archaeon]|nr:hypothetical protein [Candidatus Calditenuaceae archaeon]